MPLIEVRDGRMVDTLVIGDPTAGIPAVLLHGTPGSVDGFGRLARLDIENAQIRIARPGYERSDELPGRAIADIAADVEDVLDYLGVQEKVVVLGRSGGAPHALACGALLPDRVGAVCALAGMSPPGALGTETTTGMTDLNARSFAPQQERDAVAGEIEELARQVQQDPGTLWRSLRDDPKLDPADRAVIIDMRLMLMASYGDAVRVSVSGWRDDVLAFREPWGFDVSMIPVSVRLWHGLHDPFTPIGHAIWLAENIPTASLWIDGEAGHFGAFAAAPDMLFQARHDIRPYDRLGSIRDVEIRLGSSVVDGLEAAAEYRAATEGSDSLLAHQLAPQLAASIPNFPTSRWLRIFAMSRHEEQQLWSLPHGRVFPHDRPSPAEIAAAGMDRRRREAYAHDPPGGRSTRPRGGTRRSTGPGAGKPPDQGTDR